jgi:putative Mg2+ transporter-C (MgtC) family protein
MQDHWSLCAGLLEAVALGGAVGLERELAGKPAGIRTHALIALGAALITHVSTTLGTQPGADPGRIAAQIVSGIGFLGAGAILSSGSGAVRGLTSAATLWVVAALGMAVGAGLRHDAWLAAAVAIVALRVVARLERAVVGHSIIVADLVMRPSPSPLDAIAPLVPAGRLVSAEYESPDGELHVRATWRGRPQDAPPLGSVDDAVRVLRCRVEP